MVQFVAKRVATVIVSLLVLTMVAFALAEVIPGDPALSYAGPGRTPLRWLRRPSTWGSTGPWSCSTGCTWKGSSRGTSAYLFLPIGPSLRTWPAPSRRLWSWWQPRCSLTYSLPSRWE